MPDPSPAPPSVLLLAGAVRDAWAVALAAAGLDVRTPGWLDGVTAARVRRPDVVLVSTDLPAGAPRTICAAFRSAAELHGVPILVVGPGADRLEAGSLEPMRADRYVPAAVAGDALVAEVRGALRAGRVGMPRRVQIAVLVLVTLALAAAAVRLLADVGATDRPRAQATALELVTFGVVVAAVAAAVAIGVVRRPRPFSLVERRRLLGSGASWIWVLAVVAPDAFDAARLVAFTLMFGAWSAWAWLGPRVKPRSLAATRWFHLLAGLLALLAAAPWIAWAWMFVS